MTQPSKRVEEKEEFLHLLHQVVQHIPLKLSETAGTGYDKGYIFYQDMVLRDVEELETTMWEWHRKLCEAEKQQAVEELQRKISKTIKKAQKKMDGTTQGHCNAVDELLTLHALTTENNQK